MADLIEQFDAEDEYLPDDELVQSLAEKYQDFAESLDNDLPHGAEKTVALRKLLESRDSAFRAAREA